jgi:cytochrome c5
VFKNLSNSVQVLLQGSIMTAAILASPLAGAQSDIATISRNIQPVGQVCLAGQSCSGNGATAAGNGGAAQAAASAAAPVATAPVSPTPAPTSPAAVATFDVAATYQQSCFACHGSGAAGAPKLGDTEAWEVRMANGIDTVLANAINGLGAMPAKGMCMTCTEDNMRSLIDYLVTGGQ